MKLREKILPPSTLGLQWFTVEYGLQCLYKHVIKGEDYKGWIITGSLNPITLTWKFLLHVLL